MTKDIVRQIYRDIEQLHIMHGSCNVEMTFHDGRMQFYVLHSSIRHNVSSISGSINRTDTIETNGGRL